MPAQTNYDNRYTSDNTQNTEHSKRTVEDMPVEPVDSTSYDDGFDGFVPRKPDPSTWPVKTNKYYISSKDKVYITVLLILCAILVFFSISIFLVWHFTDVAPADTGEPSYTQGSGDEGSLDVGTGDYPFATENAVSTLLPFTDEVAVIGKESIYSNHATLVDLESNTVIASRLSDELVFPASLTKVMTLIVAVENLKTADSLKDKITVSQEVFNTMQQAGSSGAGMEPGEVLSVESMLYALILESDGIAACELAKYIAGSEAEFVAMMNEKAEDLGLTNTRFANPTGLHSDEHYSTCRELATIMAYAMNNALCKKILTEDVYIASCTQPSGRVFNYQFYHTLLMDQLVTNEAQQPSNMKIMAGKTGFTDEAQRCLVTYAETADGKGYIAVTTGAKSFAEAISDYVWIYENCAS